MSGADALITSIALQGFGAIIANPLDLAKNRYQYAKFFDRPEIPKVSQYAANYGWKRGMFQSIGYYLATPVMFGFIYDIRHKNDGAFLAALEARFLTTLFLSPLEYQRTLHQSQGLAGFDFLHCLLPLKRRGAKGLLPTIGRDLTFTSIYCGGLLLAKGSGLIATSYEQESYEKTSSGLGNSVVQNFKKPVTDPMTFFVSFFLATLATVASHPFDVVKTHMQTFPRSKFQEGILKVQEASMTQSWRHLTTGISKHGKKVTDYSMLQAGLTLRCYRLIPLFTLLGSQTFEMGWISDEDPDRAFYKLLGTIQGGKNKTADKELKYNGKVDNRDIKYQVPLHPNERKTHWDL
ncbi:unnamed protein product [Amoebophrya sp. A120]|nr:unnamed protein product [Amoebophrya sp. A120]|eukprot:GSA120T00010754001.1